MVQTASTMLPLGTKAPGFLAAGHERQDRLAFRFRRCARAVGDLHVQPLSLREARRRRAGRTGQGLSASAAWPWWASTANDVDNYPGRFARQNGRGGEAARLHVPVSLRRRRRMWPRPIMPPARPTSTCSTADRQAGLSRSDGFQPAGQRHARDRRRPPRGDGRGVGRPARSRPTRRPVSAATSSGSRATSRTILDSPVAAGGKVE